MQDFSLSYGLETTQIFPSHRDLVVQIQKCMLLLTQPIFPSLFSSYLLHLEQKEEEKNCVN